MSSVSHRRHVEDGRGHEEDTMFKSPAWSPRVSASLVVYQSRGESAVRHAAWMFRYTIQEVVGHCQLYSRHRRHGGQRRPSVLYAHHSLSLATGMVGTDRCLEGFFPRSEIRSDGASPVQSDADDCRLVMAPGVPRDGRGRVAHYGRSRLDEHGHGSCPSS